MRYRKRPVEVEALQWTGDNISDICKFIGKSVGEVLVEMVASKQDFIIKGVNGEFYPCKPNIFEQDKKITGKMYGSSNQRIIDIKKWRNYL